MAAVEAARAVHWGAIVSGALGRDRGRNDRPSCCRLGRASAQGWLVFALRAHGEVDQALRIEEALDGRASFAGAEPWRGWVAT